MDKLTYLAELAEGLARWVPERERQDKIGRASCRERV